MTDFLCSARTPSSGPGMVAAREAALFGTNAEWYDRDKLEAKDSGLCTIVALLCEQIEPSCHCKYPVRFNSYASSTRRRQYKTFFAIAF